MFRKRKQKLAGHMLGLVYVARVTVAVALLDCFHVSETGSDHENGPKAKMATTAANFLVDEPSDPEYTAGLNLQSVRDESLAWLRQHPPFIELVVQTLRVRSTVAFMLGKGTPVFGEPILLEFGGGIPDAPDPESYDALIKRVLLILPEDKRIRIKRLIDTRMNERGA